MYECKNCHIQLASIEAALCNECYDVLIASLSKALEDVAYWKSRAPSAEPIINVTKSSGVQK